MKRANHAPAPDAIETNDRFVPGTAVLSLLVLVLLVLVIGPPGVG